MDSTSGKFKDKYRITSARLKDWDYAFPGWYFITICTSERFLSFGEIRDGEVYRSPLGEIARDYWLKIPDHFPNVALDEFIVMPNHLHGIIGINAPVETPRDVRVETPRTVETQHAASLRENERNSLPKPGSISTIIRSYKSAVTRWAGQNGYESFSWQARFYDRIIRDQQALAVVRAYILENPSKWDTDDYFSPNVGR